MLEIIGRMKIKEFKRERKFSNGRVLRDYTAVAVHNTGKNTQPKYISLYISIFGNENDEVWPLLNNTWIYAKLKVTGQGDKVIFAETDLRDIGIIYRSTNKKVEELEKHITNQEIEFEDKSILNELSLFAGM